MAATLEWGTEVAQVARRRADQHMHPKPLRLLRIVSDPRWRLGLSRCGIGTASMGDPGKRHGEQVTRCRGALRIPELDLAAGIDSAQAWVRDRVFQSRVHRRIMMQ
jgi:hypothetical protein